MNARIVPIYAPPGWVIPRRPPASWWLREMGVPVLLTTPLFEYRQSALHGNSLQEHRSWWSSEELEAEGFPELFRVEWPGKGDIGAFSRGKP